MSYSYDASSRLLLSSSTVEVPPPLHYCISADAFFQADGRGHSARTARLLYILFVASPLGSKILDFFKLNWHFSSPDPSSILPGSSCFKSTAASLQVGIDAQTKI